MHQLCQPRIYRSICVILIYFFSTSVCAGTDLKWDLSYQSVLKDYEIPSNNPLYRWATDNPQRAIQDRLNEYYEQNNPTIDASLLIEMPSASSSEEWRTIFFVKAAGRASYCEFYSDRSKDRCHPLDDASRVEATIHKVMAYGHLPSDWRVKTGEGGSATSVQYDGFISIYADGVTLQRPIAHIERSYMPKNPDAGRIVRAMEEMLLSAEQLASQKQADDEKLERALMGYAMVTCLVQNPAYEATPTGKAMLRVSEVQETLRNLRVAYECILPHSVLPETLCEELFNPTKSKTNHDLYNEYEDEILKSSSSKKCPN